MEVFDYRLAVFGYQFNVIECLILLFAADNLLQAVKSVLGELNSYLHKWLDGRRRATDGE